MTVNDIGLAIIVVALIYSFYKRREVGVFIPLVFVYFVGFMFLEYKLSIWFSPLDVPFNAKSYYASLAFYMIIYAVLSIIILTRFTIAFFVILIVQALYNLYLVGAGLTILGIYVPDPMWIYAVHEFVNDYMIVPIEILLAWTCAIITKDEADERFL